MASAVMKNPEDDVMNYEKYFADRSVLEVNITHSVPCSCGNKAIRYKRKGIVPSVLNTDAVICFRCGDKQFFMSGGPFIDTSGATKVNAGGSLSISVKVIANESGPVHVGWFVPVYIRDNISEQPVLKKKNLKAGEEAVFEFDLKFTPEIPAQAYYVTAFCVQNLAVSTSREHFQVLP
jgi:hypothetical protein